MSWPTNPQSHNNTYNRPSLPYEDFYPHESRGRQRNLDQVRRIHLLREACNEVVQGSDDVGDEYAQSGPSSSYNGRQPDPMQYRANVEMMKPPGDLHTPVSQTRTYSGLPSACNPHMSFDDTSHLDLQQILSSNSLRSPSYAYSNNTSSVEMNVGLMPIAYNNQVQYRYRSDTDEYPFVGNIDTYPYQAQDRASLYCPIPAHHAQYGYDEHIFSANNATPIPERGEIPSCDSAVLESDVSVPLSTNVPARPKSYACMTLPTITVQAHTKDYASSCAAMARPGRMVTSSLLCKSLKLSPERRKLCCVEGCKSQARAFHRCKRHGGSKRCSFPGCTKSVQSRGLCIRHGGGSRCQESGCTRAAQSHGRCKMHGGGRPCIVPGCEKKAHLKRLCRKHGGGAKCSLVGCDKWAQRQGMCMTHSKNAHGFATEAMPISTDYSAEIHKSSQEKSHL